MFMKASDLHREQVLLVARCVAYVGRDQTVMQLSIADGQKTHNRWLRIGDLSHNANSFASGKSAGKNIDTISFQMQAGETRWFRKSISHDL